MAWCELNKKIQLKSWDKSCKRSGVNPPMSLTYKKNTTFPIDIPKTGIQVDYGGVFEMSRE